ncbi:hypothetical protein LguiA_017493 [Lonicera macranthoides]
MASGAGSIQLIVGSIEHLLHKWTQSSVRNLAITFRLGFRLSQPSTVEPTKCLDVFSLELTKKKGGNSSFTSSRISPCFEPEKQMDGADIGSAAIGAVFGSVLEIVKEVAITTYHFKSKLNLIEKRLISIKPKIDLIAKSNLDLNRSDDTKMFIDQLKAGEKLVLKCSKIKPWELRRSVLTRLGSTPLPLGPIPFDDGV